MRHFSALCVVFQSFASFFNFIFIPSKIAACLASRSNLLSHLLFFCPAIIFSSLSLSDQPLLLFHKTHTFGCGNIILSHWHHGQSKLGLHVGENIERIEARWKQLLALNLILPCAPFFYFFSTWTPASPFPSSLSTSSKRESIDLRIWHKEDGLQSETLSEGKKSEKGFVDDGRAFYFLCLRFHYRAP